MPVLQQSIAVGPKVRTVALEEHFNAPDLLKRISPDKMSASGFSASGKAPPLMGRASQKLPDVGQGRLADMDTNGIDVQVLSWAGPGAELLGADEAESFARDANDALAEAIAAHPSRFAGFAHLPISEPERAAAELERSIGKLGFVGAIVNGTTDGLFLDDARFEPLLATAERLGRPLYLHPGVPPKAVRDVYYGRLPPPLDFVLATYGFGWHAEVAIHVLRLVLSGTLDRYPQLKLIIGHCGEYLPMALARTSQFVGDDAPNRSARSVADTLRDQLWVTSSGLFTTTPLRAVIAAFGVERVLFSVDYPYSENNEARTFLSGLELAPSDQELFLHGNADRLLGLTAA